MAIIIQVICTTLIFCRQTKLSFLIDHIEGCKRITLVQAIILLAYSHVVNFWQQFRVLLLLFDAMVDVQI